MFERFRRDARAAVVLAQEEARELHAREVTPDHLLLGVLQSADAELSAVLSGHGLTADAVRSQLAAGAGSGVSAGVSSDVEADAAALRSIGIDLHAVRDSVDRSFGAGAFDGALHTSGRRRRHRGHIRMHRSAKEALALAIRAARDRDDEIGSAHLLVGILRGGDPAALALIGERVDAEELLETVSAR